MDTNRRGFLQRFVGVVGAATTIVARKPVLGEPVGDVSKDDARQLFNSVTSSSAAEFAAFAPNGPSTTQTFQTGDIFTIAGHTSVNALDYQSTGRLQQFVVTATF